MEQKAADVIRHGNGPDETMELAIEFVKQRKPTFVFVQRMIMNMEVWVIAVACAFSKVVPYSFLYWLPLYMTRHLHYDMGDAPRWCIRTGRGLLGGVLKAA